MSFQPARAARSWSPGIDLSVADKLLNLRPGGNEIAADGMLSPRTVSSSWPSTASDKGRTTGQAIHALRAPTIKFSFSLFRERRKVLERTATQRDGLMDAGRRDYPDLSPSEQLEEAVTPSCSASGRPGAAYSVAGRLFERTPAIEAPGNALHHGFTTAASVMRGSSGDVGARGGAARGQPASAAPAAPWPRKEPTPWPPRDWPAVERA